LKKKREEEREEEEEEEEEKCQQWRYSLCKFYLSFY
jgi:hypothetical protein